MTLMNGLGVKGSTDQPLYRGHMERTGFPESVIAIAAPIISEGDADNILKVVRECNVEYRKQVEADITKASIDFINEEEFIISKCKVLTVFCQLLSSKPSIMKKVNLLIILLVVLISSIHAQSPPIASPLQSGAYIPGLINPRDYSNPGTSGLIGMDYNVFFNTGQYFDHNGDKADMIDLGLGHGPVPIDVDISGYLNSLVVAYVSPELSFLGNSRYLAFLAPLYSTADFRVGLSELADSTIALNGSTGGFGDMGVAPLYLTWSLGEDKLDITTGYMFTAPTGRYTTGADDNIGLGYWNHSFQLFTYYYLMQKATALYLANTFEVHSKIKDVDVRPGSRYTIEYGVSQYLSERFEITVQGGHTWQVGEDSGDDVYWDSSFKDRNSTIGAGLGFWFVKEMFYTNLKWWTNYGMRQHFKVNNFQVQLLYIPGILKSAKDK